MRCPLGHLSVEIQRSGWRCDPGPRVPGVGGSRALKRLRVNMSPLGRVGIVPDEVPGERERPADHAGWMPCSRSASRQTRTYCGTR